MSFSDQQRRDREDEEGWRREDENVAVAGRISPREMTPVLSSLQTYPGWANQQSNRVASGG